MDCPSCGNTNREGARFCDNCGTRLETGVAVAPEGPAGNGGAPDASEHPAATSLPDGTPPSLGDGRYRLEEFLGSGGRKNVYAGLDSADGRRVAIALFEATAVAETARTRARRESEAMGRLGKHPRIVEVLDFGEEDGRPFIVSELVTGGDLAELIGSHPGGRVPPERVVGIGVDICDGLAHAHGCGVFHRDLKPANIWLDSEGRAEIGDFGLATSGGAADAESGAVVGTVTYLPPEQALGRHAGAASDIYSLGALLYEMLCGEAPFQGEDAVAVISSHLNTEPTPPSARVEGVPDQLDALVLDMLAKDPGDRPSLEEVRERLEGADLSLVSGREEEQGPRGLTGGIFVGREKELAQLREAADQALEGSGGLVTLVGEPGIGKTRTLEELATYIRVRGARVHRGHSHEGEGAPAYWPWIEAIRSYIREADPVGLAWEVGGGYDELARLVPELADRLGRDAPAERGAGEADRFRLFDAVASFLSSAARTRALMIALEDVHWADEPSLQLLRFIASEAADAPLLVIATYRDVELGRHHALAETLGELASVGKTRKISLRGLRLPSIERYMEMTLGKAPPPRLVDAVFEQTDGNPFFVAETVRLLATEADLSSDDGDWELSVPQGVRELVGRRLDQLPAAANEVLAAAAAIGREFERDLLEGCAKASAKKVERHLDAAVEAGVLQRLGSSRFSFTHALIRETLYEELSSAQRVKIHARIAAELEKNLDGRSRLSELAHHYFEAAVGGDVERAIEYAIQAGRQAREQLAHEEAAEHLSRARQLFEERSEQALEVTIELADAQIRSGQFSAARSTIFEAVEDSRSLDSAEGLVGSALLLAQITEVGESDEELIGVYQEALEKVTDDGQRSRLMTALAFEWYWSDPQGTARQMVEQALELAREAGDEEAEVAALAGRHFLLFTAEDGLEERLDNGRKLLELARRSGGIEQRIRAHAFMLTTLMSAGEVAAVERELRTYADLAARTREPRHLWHIPIVRASRSIMEGDFAAARELSEQGRRMGERAEEPLSQQFSAIQLSLIHALEGTVAEMLPLVREMAERFPAIRAWRISLASFLCEADRLDEARVEYEQLAARDFEDIPVDAQWLPAVSRLADTAFRLGDVERARLLYPLLEPFAGEMVVIGRATTVNGPVDLYLGSLALTRGRSSDAVAHLETAVDLAKRAGDRPFTVISRITLAQALLAREGSGDHERALELLSKAIDNAQDFGMRLWLERGLRLRLEAQGVSGLDTTDSIDSVALAAEQEAGDIAAHAAADGTVTILFSDIENSTLMTERLGDERWIEVLRAHNEIFRDRIEAHGGYEVKNQGDGFMLAFPSPVEALAAAEEIQRDFTASTAPEDERIRVRMGLHTGEAIVEDGDFFGRTVILAARIAAQAKGEEVLVSDEMREMVDAADPERFRFSSSVRLELKGLAGTHTAHRLDWAERPVTAGA